MMSNAVASSTSSEEKTIPLCIKIDLGLYISRSITDEYWQIVDVNHIKTWEIAKNLLSYRKFETEYGVVEIKMNWSPVLKRLRHNHKIIEKLHLNKDLDNVSRVLNEFKRKSVSVNFEIKNKFDVDKKRSYCCNFVEYILYDVFFIMNVSSPSSFSLYNSRIKNEKYMDRLNLSNYFFETAIVDGLDGKWPSISFLNLPDVLEWYFKARTELKMLPKNRMEKVIFSMLNLCSSPTSPTQIVWLFYALETLFDCKVGENLRILKLRIELLLQPNETEAKFLSKSLRELYDLRSSFVHGGLEVIHPMNNEVIDSAVDSSYRRLMETTDFGFRLLFSAVQQIIKKGWIEPIFNEEITGRVY